MSERHEVFHWGSLFLHIATPDEIEQERLRMEQEYDKLFEVFDTETVTRSGALVTRVSWKVVG